MLTEQDSGSRRRERDKSLASFFFFINTLSMRLGARLFCPADYELIQAVTLSRRASDAYTTSILRVYEATALARERGTTLTFVEHRVSWMYTSDRRLD
ncbi:hypothetical protein EVAR_35614_1 [Eumeta japonica]|uniref:Uncharacterized protein n=1 Tax=Eumeta variegata TaxID=151549 RepID=A0A4C1WD71_EUMVA|nr:hypothetical protein EVAR_35614_1 [Eumeta japonica]